MLDVSGIGIVRLKMLQTRSEHDLRTESGSSYRNKSSRRLLRRKVRRAAVSGATWFGTIQIAAEASQ
jgi:hypothetical protein